MGEANGGRVRHVLADEARALSCRFDTIGGIAVADVVPHGPRGQHEAGVRERDGVEPRVARERREALHAAQPRDHRQEPIGFAAGGGRRVLAGSAGGIEVLRGIDVREDARFEDGSRAGGDVGHDLHGEGPWAIRREARANVQRAARLFHVGGDRARIAARALDHDVRLGDRNEEPRVDR